MAQPPRVLIVGAGPVGLVAALRLINAGFQVTVLEQAAALHAEPRASTFHPPTLELLDTLGLTPDLLAQGRPAPYWQYQLVETGEAAIFDLSVLADETPYPFRFQCEQFKLVVLAAAHLERKAPGTIRFNTRVTSVAQTAETASLTVEQDGRSETLIADWVLGCDGASSVIRTTLGLGFAGDTYPIPNMTVGTPFQFEGKIPGLLNVNYFWSDFGSFSMFHTRDMWRVGYSPPSAMSDAEATAPETVEAMLQRILPQPQPYPIATARLYRIHKRVTETFRVGRVFLAGDAAHLNSPSGGFGMNGGVQDAFALTEKLIAVAQGADPIVLDRYTRQRRAAAVADIQLASDANHKRHRESDPARRRTTLAEMKAITADRARMKAFLMENALIASYRRSEATP